MCKWVRWEFWHILVLITLAPKLCSVFGQYVPKMVSTFDVLLYECDTLKIALDYAYLFWHLILKSFFSCHVYLHSTKFVNVFYVPWTRFWPAHTHTHAQCLEDTCCRGPHLSVSVLEVVVLPGGRPSAPGSAPSTDSLAGFVFLSDSQHWICAHVTWQQHGPLIGPRVSQHFLL